MGLSVTLQDREEEILRQKKHGNLKIDARGLNNK